MADRGRPVTELVLTDVERETLRRAHRNRLVTTTYQSAGASRIARPSDSPTTTAEPRRAETHLFSSLRGQLARGIGNNDEPQPWWTNQQTTVFAVSAESSKNPSRISYTSGGLPILESVAW
jgi:hypothetical protein